MNLDLLYSHKSHLLLGQIVTSSGNGGDGDELSAVTPALSGII